MGRGSKEKYPIVTRPDPQDLAWYAARTPPQKEFYAERVLSRAGYNAILPTESKWRRRSRYTKQKRLVHYPLLCRYLLIGFDAEPNWFALFSTRAVQSIVGIAGEPRQIAYEAVARFIYRQDQAPREQQFMTTYQEHKTGDLVRIIDGAFEGHKVRVEAIYGARARVLLDFLGDPQKVSIRLDYLHSA